jgi:hypothetical protein
MEKQQASSMFPGGFLKRGVKSTNNFFTDNDSTAAGSLPQDTLNNTPSGKSESVMDQIAAISASDKK